MPGLLQRYTLSNFGHGLDTTRNPTLVQEGYARVSQNLLHNRGDNRCERRAGIDRIWATRTGTTPVYMLYEFINNSGTSFPLTIVNGKLELFSLTPTTAKINLGDMNQSINIPCATTALNFCLIADHRGDNFITDGSAVNTYKFQIIAPVTVPTAIASSGAGLSVGTYRYDYARYSSVTGEISPAYGTATAVTTTAANSQVTFSSAIAVSGQFDQIRIYRTKVSTTGPYYLVTTITVAAFNVGYIDSTADTALTVLSTIHSSAGASQTTRPEAANDVVFHRGRVHFIGLNGARSRHRWSQLNAYQFDSTTSSRHNVEPDDGDFLWRGFSYDGTLILMKDHSIHLMNGDVDENSFTWQIASDRYTGIGCYCPFTAVPTPIGIIFMGECGVYSYRPGMSKPERISDSIQTTLDGLNYSRRLFFVGGYDPCERAYIVAVTPTGQTTNTECYVYFIDTGYWSKWIYANGKINPSTFATMHTSSVSPNSEANRLKYFLGDINGYGYQGDATTGSDGVTSGTQGGTTTGGSATSVVDTGATFRTVGNGLLNLSTTVQSGTAFETQLILSNTGTTLTTAAWNTIPISGLSYYISAIDIILSLGRLDMGEVSNKRFIRMSVEFQSQSHNVPLLVGYTLDGDTQPTTVQSVTQNGKFICHVPINRIGAGLSPYIRCNGTGNDLTILKVDVEYVPLAARLPFVS